MKTLNESLKALDPYIAGIENLTKVQRLLICIGTIVLIVGLFTYFSFYPKIEKIQQLSKEYKTLSQELERMQKEASKLAFYRKKMKEKQTEFNLVKRALPEKKEIPTLLTSISQSGHDSGLEFLLFKPEKEVVKDFYAEIPVSIQVTGNYHNVGLFLSKVASLPRVVNVRNLKLKPLKGGPTLKTSCTAVTYRFIEKKPKSKKVKKKKK